MWEEDGGGGIVSEIMVARGPLAVELKWPVEPPSYVMPPRTGPG